MTTSPSKLLKRVQFWQKELATLGISAWRLDELELVESDDFRAQVCASSHYDLYKLRFDREFLEDATEQDLDETIVHELLHVVMRDLDTATDRAIRYTPGGEDGELHSSIKLAREALVHRLSLQIVSTFYADKG